MYWTVVIKDVPSFFLGLSESGNSDVDSISWASGGTGLDCRKLSFGVLLLTFSKLSTSLCSVTYIC